MYDSMVEKNGVHIRVGKIKKFLKLESIHILRNAVVVGGWLAKALLLQNLVL